MAFEKTMEISLCSEFFYGTLVPKRGRLYRWKYCERLLYENCSKHRNLPQSVFHAVSQLSAQKMWDGKSFIILKKCVILTVETLLAT